MSMRGTPGPRHVLAAKRQRGRHSAELGAASESDLPTAQNNAPSSSALSSRNLPYTSVPALTTLCGRIFIANVKKLAKDEEIWKHTCQYLKILPDSILPKIFSMLRSTCPEILTSAFISAYFLRGPSITLTSALPGVRQDTITAIATTDPTLRELELSGFEQFSDKFFASLLSKLPNLRIVILRGCSKVGSKTIEAAAGSCPSLISANLNYTSVTPVSLVSLVRACPLIQVLKVAGIANWTDATFAKFLQGITQNDHSFKLNQLRTLKLRQTLLSETSLTAITSRCPNLRRLDVSFTAIRRLLPLPFDGEAPHLEKLCLTSTMLPAADLLSVVTQLPKLTTLSLGALGGGLGSSASMGNSSAMTMNDGLLNALTDILETFLHLENISLVGNTKLGLTKIGATASFIRRVGRNCKRLNLANIPSLRSSDLAGLQSDTVEQVNSRLEILVLNNTGVDDEAASYISGCPFIETLEVAGTKFTSAGLYSIINSCSKLDKLDVTSCRGVRVTDRRRFFEVWATEGRHHQ